MPHIQNSAVQLPKLGSGQPVNVASTERIGSSVAGLGLLGYGLSRNTWTGWLLAVIGGSLLYRGATGHCSVYDRLGIDTNSGQKGAVGVPDNKGTKVVRSVIVERSREDLYRFWRNLENLPRFMKHVESVRVLDDKRSHWIVRGPLGENVEWYAEIVSEREGEMLSWQSLPGADVQNAGSVWFETMGDGTSTRVKVALEYQPPADKLGVAVAKLFGEDPDRQLIEDLGRLKVEMENGAPSAVVL